MRDLLAHTLCTCEWGDCRIDMTGTNPWYRAFFTPVLDAITCWAHPFDPRNDPGTRINHGHRPVCDDIMRRHCCSSVRFRLLSLRRRCEVRPHGLNRHVHYASSLSLSPRGRKELSGHTLDEKGKSCIDGQQKWGCMMYYHAKPQQPGSLTGGHYYTIASNELTLMSSV